MKQTTTVTQGIHTFLPDTYLLTWAEAFLIDRKVQNLSPGTLEFYRKKLKLFTEFCDAHLLDKSG